MVEDILNFSLSGIYSLLVLSLTFNFLLAMRVRRLNNILLSHQGIHDEKIMLLRQRLELFEAPKEAERREEGDKKKKAKEKEGEDGGKG